MAGVRCFVCGGAGAFISIEMNRNGCRSPLACDACAGFGRTGVVMGLSFDKLLEILNYRKGANK